ncbi:MAG TPA: cation:proton antiporter [Candidatus Binatia bacterium]|nr:cation:proton antiporter [Candidatus Binatia bacterium]
MIWTSVFLLLVAAGQTGESTAGSEFAPILFGLAVLVVGAKLGGLWAERWGQPSVLGELLFGIALANLSPLVGGGGIEFVRSNETLRFLAEVGVLILLFDVGLESDLRAFAKVGVSAVLVAMIGVAVPFVLGWSTAKWLLPDSPAISHVFIGATLTATSVGITVRVLKDLGVTGRPEGQTIIGAAILDDVLGLIILAAVVGGATVAHPSGGNASALSIAAIVLKAAGFLGVAVLLGHFLSSKIVGLVSHEHGTFLIIGVAVCFTFAYIAEMIGLADIIGAFAAGVFLDPYGVGVRTKTAEITLRELLTPLSDVFVPLFFVLMGLQVDLVSLADPSALTLGVLLIVGAVIGKLVCGLGVVGRGINRLAVGLGMIPRGEVGLIFAGIGARVLIEGQPILTQNVYSAVVMMVLITTLVTPLGLRWVFRKQSRGK